MQLTFPLSMAAAIGLLLGGCAAYPSSPAAAVPSAVAAPAGTSLFLDLQASGAQVYRCARKADTTYAWQFVAPDAALRSAAGALVGKHYAGPTWETLDGSSVAAEVKASAPSSNPSAVPVLLLAAKSHAGSGPIAGTKYVQRLDTVGGVAPTSGCETQAQVGAEARVAYTARYVFYR